MKLWQKVVLALVLGVFGGYLLNAQGPLHYDGSAFLTAYVKPIGTIFISLIKMVVVPLIFFSLVLGITGMTDAEAFKRIGIKSVSAYLFTAAFAVIIGLGFGYVFEPGKHIDLSTLMKATSTAKAPAATSPEQLAAVKNFVDVMRGSPGAVLPPATPAQAEAIQKFSDMLTKTASGVKPPAPPEKFDVVKMFVDMVPTNAIEAMATDHILQVVVFAIFFAVTINKMAGRAKAVREFCHESAYIVFQMIQSVMGFAPYGVFALTCWVVSSQGFDVIKALGILTLCVLAALFTQYLLFGLMLIVFGRLSPMPFYRKILETQSLAFSTSSSKAALPTAMRVVSERMGVSPSTTSFVLPLGTSINMDGTAIYLGICSLFFAQAYGITLQPQQYILLILTATLGSIGAAGIPGGSIAMMGMVFTSVGLPLDGIAVILGIDRILDMLRTTVNITGDSVITLLVDKSEGTFNERAYYDKLL